MAARGAGPETGLVIEVDTAMPAPAEVNKITFSYRDGSPGAWSESPSLVLVHHERFLQPGSVVLPVRYGLVGAVGAGAQVSVRVALSFDTNEIVSREVVLVMGSTANPLKIQLERGCAKTSCPPERTCVPGWGCVSDGYASRSQ